MHPKQKTIKAKTLYSVHEALITEYKVLSIDLFTDSSLKGKLAEITYKDFGESTVTLMNDNDIYQMNFQTRFVTLSERLAVSRAIKGFNRLDIVRGCVVSKSQYFSKYFEKYPELFI